MNLFPKTPDFFILFQQMTRAIEKQYALLVQMEKHPKQAIALAKKIRDLETDVDILMHTIDSRADTTFITPFDREDLHQLARQLNSIADNIENAAAGLTLTKFNHNGKHLPAYLTIVGEMTEAISSLINNLAGRDKYLHRMKETIRAVHDAENEGDDLFRNALHILFSKRHDARTIFKWQYVYDNLELVLDACERTADIVNTIIIKNY